MHWRSTSIRLLILLFLGLVTSVAVAWRIAARQWRPRSTHEILCVAPDKTAVGFTDRRTGWSSCWLLPVLDPASAPRSLNRPPPPAWAAAPTDPLGKTTFAFGWPAVCLCYEQHHQFGVYSSGDELVWSRAVVCAGFSAVLPLRPHVPGLLVNTATYAAAWAVIWVGLAASRAAVRRGRCARCGYEVAGLKSPVCPECGTKLPRGTSPELERRG